MMDFGTLIASTAPELTNIIGKFMNVLYEGIGNFGWTVVVFTLILKIALSPLDLWQKFAQRKQSLSMSRIQPQMAKIQKQYAARPDILKQKQAELYKKEKLGAGSMLGSCLPMIVTMVVFFVVFSGFTAMVKYQNELMVHTILTGYDQLVIEFGTAGAIPAERIAALYTPESWLWVKNIFMSDTWGNVIPTIDQFLGTGLGSIGAAVPEGINIPDWYNTLLGPAADGLNKESFWNASKWNGYFVLPVLSIGLSIVSAKAMQATSSMAKTGTEEQQKKQKNTQKMMLFIMPLIMGVFSMFYSAAFCIYMIVNSLISTIYAITFNLITKAKDKAREAKELATTYI